MIDATITWVQQWMQFITGYALKIFSASQWMTMFLALLAVMVLTEMFKQVVLWKTKGPQLRRDIYLTAFLIGIGCAIVGYVISPVMQPLWFWVMLGVSSGYVSIYIYKWIVPTLKWIMIALKKFILNRFPFLGSDANEKV